MSRLVVESHSRASCFPRLPSIFACRECAFPDATDIDGAAEEATDAAGLACLIARCVLDALSSRSAESLGWLLVLAVAVSGKVVACAALMALKSRTVPFCANLRNSFSFSAPPDRVSIPSILLELALFHCENGIFGLPVHPAITSAT